MQPVENIDTPEAAPESAAGPAAALDPAEAENGLAARYPTDWQSAVQSAVGASKPRHILPRELAAVGAAMLALEEELEGPVLAADRLILGSLTRLVLAEFRLSRLLFGEGFTTKGGEVRPTTAEWRAIIRLKADLLKQLTFRRGKAPAIDLATYLDGRRGPAVEQDNPMPCPAPAGAPRACQCSLACDPVAGHAAGQGADHD